MGITVSYVVALVCAAFALLFALGTAVSIGKKNAGSDRMKEIAGYISEGAKAFIGKEYSIISIFIVILFVIIALALNWQTAICFVLGAGCSMLAGFIGMRVAVKANVRTTAAAKNSLAGALKVAFAGGSVMGLSVSGLGVLGLSVACLLFMQDLKPEYVNMLTGFSLGASFIALFSRVGGGIYTKAADVGADLVGKVEAGIPEDDPRNPAVIADNVGDNVGDVAGMGADLFESYVGSIISALSLAVLSGIAGGTEYVVFTMVVVALGIISSLLGTLFVNMLSKKDPMKALNGGEYIGMAIFVVLAFIASHLLLGNLKGGAVAMVGLVAGALIGKFTEMYTADNYKSVQKIAEQSETGAATNIISGLSVGMRSTMLTIVVIAIAILCANAIDPQMGLALVAVGMLATTGMTVAVDAYGPIADNAGGIAEMSGQDPEVRERTDSLDSVGNTTAAIGKGFAIGSAALTALALFQSYANAVGMTSLDMLRPAAVIGLLIGAMLPFLFSSMAIDAVSSAAGAMIAEVRSQFKSQKGILQGTEKPDYKKCVAISTASALKNMILPALIAIVIPMIVGMISTLALGGLLVGALATGVMLAIFMSNAGGAWDNAKKYIESGQHGGKGSDPHKAAVIGDTVGDPLKDTAGPSLNILIKLMTVVALVFAPMFAKVSPIVMTFFQNLFK